MSQSTERKPASKVSQSIFALVAGLFVSLGLLKFGNPVILAHKISTPNGLEDWINSTWPIELSYWGFIPLIACAFLVGRWKARRPQWLFAMPLIWLIWQFVSATQTVSSDLTALTLKHFTASVVCFYIGWWALAEVENLWPFWLPILVTVLWIIRLGFQQHSGGLQQLKEYLTIYVLPYETTPSELLARLAKNRIFGTLVYPNTLAGALLFLMPPLLATIWMWGQRLMITSRVILVACVAAAAAVCLYWTGSKSGWLLALILIAAALLHSNIPKKVKIAVGTAILIGGLSGFFIKYAGFFQKGATSVVARADYWRAAVKIFATHPVLGTGPGTFFIPYQKIKDPSAELARLCHNDYLEQACDSGLIGFLGFSAAIWGGLAYLYRYRIKSLAECAILVGLFGVCAQSFLEFNFYIPAMGWPIFLLLGYLFGRTDRKSTLKA